MRTVHLCAALASTFMLASCGSGSSEPGAPDGQEPPPTDPLGGASSQGGQGPGVVPDEDEEERTHSHAAESGNDTTATGAIFRDVSAAAGVDVAHSSVWIKTPPGVSWADFDRNGTLDLYVTNAAGPNRTLLSNGDGTFSWRDDASTLPEHFSTGTAVADYDNDGWSDIFVSGDLDNVLLRNTMTGFEDVSSGFDVSPTRLGISGAWGDYDSDGDLDLYVGSHELDANVRSSSLYRNDGAGKFTDVSAVLDDGPVENPMLAAAFFDYDNDGDPDLYVVVDRNFGNILWRNDGEGCGSWCFTDVSALSNTGYQVDGMGVATGDYDNDGDLDIYFTELGDMYLLQNQTAQGSPTFVDVTDEAGVSVDHIGWGTVMFDYNNDGWLDIFEANGGFEHQEPNQLFRNNGDGTFENVTLDLGGQNSGVSQGVAYADYNRDGHLDLAVGNRNDGFELLQNTGTYGAENSWVSIELRGVTPINRDAIGSRVRLERTDGVTLLAEVQAGSSMGSTNQLALHFGLGTAEIASVSVIWSDGEQEDIPLETIEVESPNTIERQVD